jgi:DNA helicase-2/ATP-dependent DNA helicase PcrA
MTAHSSKGLEYDTVYIYNAVENVWGRKAKTKSRLLNYPENMPLKQAGDRVDEQIRLFYVSMTRAKTELMISYSQLNSKEKHTDLVEFLVSESIQPIPISIKMDANQIIEIAEINWYEPLVNSKKI